MNDAYKMIKEFAADGRLCVINLHGENVIGEFFADEYSTFTGYSFRSSICPKFIHEDNARFNEECESALTGFASEVTSISLDGDDLLISFDEEYTVYHRVCELVVFGKNCYDTGSPCRK